MQPVERAKQVEVRLYGEFSQVAKRDRMIFDVPAASMVRDVFTGLCREHPALESCLIGQTGSVRSEINVLPNGRPIRAQRGSETRVEERDRLFVLRTYGGG